MNDQMLHVAYDRPVDVLRVVQGDLPEYEGDGFPKGLELDFAVDDNSACGAKVIGFERNGWRGEISHLAALIAEHLSLDPMLVERAIKKAIQ